MSYRFIRASMAGGSAVAIALVFNNTALSQQADAGEGKRRKGLDHAGTRQTGRAPVYQRRWRGVNYVRLLRSRGYSGLDALDGQTASMIATGQTILSGVDGDDRRDLLVSWLIARHKD